MAHSKPVKLAIVGGHRGASFDQAIQILSNKIELIAVCDIDDDVLKLWSEKHPGIRVYKEYEKLLADSDIDAVFLATPLFIHARQAIQAMQAGKHVLSEVIAAHTLDDCWELVETVEKSAKVYMMAENYCYMRSNMMVKTMAEKGVFGKLTYAEGAYIHDCRELTHYSNGRLTWRGDLQKNYNGMNYPTHSLGPLAQWMGINREGGDQLATMATFVTQSLSARNYYYEVFGEEHPGSKSDYWGQGDSATTVIKTKRGAVIVLRVDWISPRPHNMTHYVLQGTKGAYLSARHHEEDPLIWLEGRSPGQSYSWQNQAKWESLWTHSEEFEHPLWRQWRSEADQVGHGGGDFFVLLEFVSSILENRRPAIDVYDAVTWSSLFPLSARSIAAGGRPVDIPDFSHRQSEPNR